MSTALVWLRRDLRIHDHRALAAATAAHTRVIVCVCIEDRYCTGPRASQHRTRFYLRLLDSLAAELAGIGSVLVLRHGDASVEIPALAKHYEVRAVYTTKDTSAAGRNRDQHLEKRLASAGIAWHSFVDQTLFDPESLRNGDGQPYKVFTPFRRLALQRIETVDLRQAVIKTASLLQSSEEAVKTQRLLVDLRQRYAVDTAGSSFFPPDRKHAVQRLRHFLQAKVDSYHDDRDRLDREGTSQLSAYLKFGVLSVREVVHAIEKTHGPLALLTPGPATFLSELLWREFYHTIFFHYPTTRTKNFNPRFDSMVWPNRPDWITAWKEGKTGVPIVDAGMRALVSTGFLHNRARMIVASFLCKDLLCDWRIGEEFFASMLVDYDPASNIGGWQWAAGTGTDAQPYFRIFNPATQQKRFDPESRYVAHYVPEYGTDEYPHPIVDHTTQRAAALTLYSAA